MLALLTSMAAIDCVPAVLRVALKVAVPLVMVTSPGRAAWRRCW
jgi:hypothetical protein